MQARNQADALVHSVKKSLTEHGDKLPAGEREKIEAALEGCRRPAGDNGRDRGQDRGADGGRQKLGEKVHAESQAAHRPVQAAAGLAGPAGRNVVDGDFSGAKKPTRTSSTPSSRRSGFFAK